MRGVLKDDQDDEMISEDSGRGDSPNGCKQLRWVFSWQT